MQNNRILSTFKLQVNVFFRLHRLRVAFYFNLRIQILKILKLGFVRAIFKGKFPHLIASQLQNMKDIQQL